MTDIYWAEREGARWDVYSKQRGWMAHADTEDDARLIVAGLEALQAPPAAVQAWILRTGHGTGIHVGEKPPVDCVGWKPLTAGDIKDAPPAEVPSLVDEGLSYFERVGDAGDCRYVEAIRAHIAMLAAAARKGE